MCSKEILERRGTAAASRWSELVSPLALSAFVFLTGGAMAQTQQISPLTGSSGMYQTTPVRAHIIDEPASPAAASSPFDVAPLPPVESIETGSDIGPFLASGVPADLTRAALRRAWSTDPAIRDFVGLSENDWDFNAPAPGFGSLTTDDVRRLWTQERALAGFSEESPNFGYAYATAAVLAF